MVENTRLKELSAQVSKLLELFKADRQENKIMFETLEVAMDSLLKTNTASPPLFQVCNVKLDFPRFDDSEVP